MRRITTAALIVIAALLVVPSAIAGRGGDGAKDNDTRVQILAINDFHGHVEPNTPGTIQIGQSRNAAGAIVNEVVPAGGAEYLATHVKGSDHELEHDHRRLRRPDRREPAAVGAVPRRAGDRGAQRRRAGRQRRRQPRVRRGPRRDLPDDERRLPSGRRLPGRDAVPRVGLRLPRCERLLRGDGRHDPAAYEVRKVGTRRSRSSA